VAEEPGPDAPTPEADVPCPAADAPNPEEAFVVVEGEPDPPTAVGTFVVVSDERGFVGAYPTVGDAREALEPYAGIPFAYCEWARHLPATEAGGEATEAGGEATEAGGEATKAGGEAGEAAEELVWILPYSATGAVACAATNKSVAEAAQRALAPLNLVNTDDVKYWEAVMGVMPEPAKERLEGLAEAFQVAVAATTPGGEAAVQAAEKKSAADAETIANFIKYSQRGDPEPEPEPKRINILEGVVPCEF